MYIITLIKGDVLYLKKRLKERRSFLAPSYVRNHNIVALRYKMQYLQYNPKSFLDKYILKKKKKDCKCYVLCCREEDRQFKRVIYTEVKCAISLALVH